ncbi:hypothetical protein LPJ63_002956 [Coemansia sp. RSA 2711]|nr:hypothetical protein LPJ63_002956 [Coemansia sp. RSA 2711]
MAPKIESNSGAVYDELLEHYERMISVMRQTRSALEQAPAPGEQRPTTRAELALELFQEMIEDMTMGVVFETHFEAKQLAGVCALCNTRQVSGLGSETAAVFFLDADSAVPASVCVGAGLAVAEAEAGALADAFECPSCQRSFPAARFAAHMDKCMGLSSRRAATRSRPAAVAASAASTPVPAGYESSGGSSTGAARRGKRGRNR